MRTTTAAALANTLDCLTTKDPEAVRAIMTLVGSKKPEEEAAALLDRFNTLPGILEATPEALRATVAPSTADRIAALLPCFRAYSREKATENGRFLTDRRKAEAYIHSLLDGKPVEEFYVVAVNARCKLLGARRIATGDLSEVNAYPRLVMKAAIDLNAHAVFFAHNHPGGTCAPSSADIQSTLQLKRMLSAAQVLTLDHIIIADPHNAYSMAQHGDVEFGR